MGTLFICNSLSMEIVLFVAALVVSFLVFTWLIRVVKATVTTAITIALVILALQLLFGLRGDDVMQTVFDIWRRIWQTISGRS